MRLRSYVVLRDYGFAPNPFFGYCTLATCKPTIRRISSIGDWIVGTGSKQRGRADKLVFAMKVTEVLPYDRYWRDTRFDPKKPNLRGSKKQAFGDNIYHRHAASGAWCQKDSHHSLKNGQPNQENVQHDTQTDRVLVSSDFVYWGGVGPEIPVQFAELYVGRGHRANFRAGLEEEFVEWLRQRGEMGYAGQPLDWARTP